MEQRSVSLYDQHATLPALKQERSSLTRVHSQVLQNVAVRLDLAFQAFFRRVQAGEPPGYPRFRGRGWYDSFCYPQSGFAVEGQAIKLSKIGLVRAVIHRPISGQVKTCSVRRASTGKWFACFSCEVDAEPLPATDRAVGIDVGLTMFATLSTGEAVPNPRFFQRDERALGSVCNCYKSRRMTTTVIKA